MVDVKKAAEQIAKLTAMRFFPTEKRGRAAVVEVICEMAGDNAQIDWLVNRAVRLFDDWPGLHELRAVFCSKFAPRDGINAYSKVYPEGIPSEREAQNAIAAPAMKALPAGRTVSADEGLDAAVMRAANARRMPDGIAGDNRTGKLLREALTAPCDRPEIAPTPQIITQADIDKAVAELRERKASEHPSDADWQRRAAGDR